jgi:hypothetical protein
MIKLIGRTLGLSFELRASSVIRTFVLRHFS